MKANRYEHENRRMYDATARGGFNDNVRWVQSLMNSSGHTLERHTKVKRIFGVNAVADSYFDPGDTYTVREVCYIDGLRRVGFFWNAVRPLSGAFENPANGSMGWDADLFEVVS